MVFSGRELLADLVRLTMQDYDVILRMDFLRKYNAMIKCQSRRVIFRPPGKIEFEYSRDNSKKPKRMISAMKAAVPVGLKPVLKPCSSRKPRKAATVAVKG